MTSERELFADSDVRVTYHESLAGRLAEADGGQAVEGGQAGYRATFKGRLTGRRLAQGDPPWHWLELGELTEAPDAFEHAYVWVDEEYVYLVEDGRQ